MWPPIVISIIMFVRFFVMNAKLTAFLWLFHTGFGCIGINFACKAADKHKPRQICQSLCHMIESIIKAFNQK